MIQGTTSETTNVYLTYACSISYYYMSYNLPSTRMWAITNSHGPYYN